MTDNLAAIRGKSSRLLSPHVWNLRDGHVMRFRRFTDTAVVQTAIK